MLLCTELSKHTTAMVCAAFTRTIFHPGRMQMHRKTNVKSIKSFIKHLEFRQHQCACRSPVQWPFRLGVTVPCIITGASTCMATTLNKAYLSVQPVEINDVASEHKANHRWNMQTDLQHCSFN